MSRNHDNDNPAYTEHSNCATLTKNHHTTKNSFYRRDIISAKDFTKEDIEAVLHAATRCKNGTFPKRLQDRIIANCFFEPSTRTRLSFASAANRLGASVIGFSNSDDLSVRKGETLYDTIQVINSYADLIVLRHPAEGAARFAAENSAIPVINAGDGANQHPTQALTDLFTMLETQGTLNGLSIALAGDLKYARAIHSLVELCSLFDIRMYFVAPESLALSEILCDWLKKRGVRFSFHRALSEVIKNIDILYLIRIQSERANHPEIQHARQEWVLTASMLEGVRNNMKILHPLPRMNELPMEIDTTAHAGYFDQAKNGVFIRQAMLDMILNEEIA